MCLSKQLKSTPSHNYYEDAQDAEVFHAFVYACEDLCGPRFTLGHLLRIDDERCR